MIENATDATITITLHPDAYARVTDDLLAAQLKAQGFNVARRTVAKYRDVLGIPTTRLRKR